MSEQAVFDALIEEFYPVWFRYHPDVAGVLGISGFESRLPAAEDDELGALATWLESLVVALGELNFSALDPDRQLDYRLLIEAAQVEYHELVRRDWRHLDPTRYLPVQEIFQLTLHPTQELQETLLKLLRAVPGYLRQARGRLAEFPPLLAPEMVRVAMEEADAGVSYLRSLSDSVWLRHQCRGTGEVQGVCEQAVGAIQGYVEVLRKDIAPSAQGPLGCGEAHFLRLLERRHFVDIPLEGLRTYLDALFQDKFRQLEVDAHSLGVAGEPGFVLAYLQQQPAYSGQHRLQVYREETNRLRQFVRLGGYLTLPEQPFRIVERPACPRPGLCDSGYLELPERSGGVFFIAGREGEDVLFGEPRSVIRSHCIRRSWTGAHLLSYSGGERARDLPRRLAPAAAFATAWDLYFRQFLLGTDYCSDEDRLVQLLYQMQALRLALLDVDLNLGRIGAKQAFEAITELHPDPSHALRKLANLARHPGDALAGAAGWLMLHQARTILQIGQDASVGEFHDRVLSQGPVPPALLLPHLFGGELWTKVKDELTI
jgi:uncharacterized protein (DUF885 family)